MPILDTLKKLYKLSPSDFEDIQQDIIDIYTHSISKIRNPTVIILGAQPGAGKTELEKQARTELFDNVVTCNADLFRDFHPHANLIRAKHPSYYPELTAGYAQAWNKGLRDYCEAHKLSYILETTFSSGELMNQTIGQLKELGYRIELKLLAVHPKLSLLGTQVRYESMLAVEGSGRQVSISAHEERFVNLPKTLGLVQQERLYDEICIYGRNIASDQNSITEGIHLIAKNPDDPLSVFRAEIEKEWPVKMVVYFDQWLEQVIDMKISRKSSAEEIKEFVQSLDRKIPLVWPENSVQHAVKIEKTKTKDGPQHESGMGLGR